jgi:hypothetical protein
LRDEQRDAIVATATVAKKPRPFYRLRGAPDLFIGPAIRVPKL